MGALTGELISATYKDLLQISNANAGVDATLRFVEDGEGTASTLKLSTDLVEIYKVGTQLKLSGGAADYATFAVAADGQLVITTVDDTAAQGDICLMPDGKVGKGTLTPLKAAEIYDTADASLYLHRGATTAGAYGEVSFGGSTSEIYHAAIRGIRPSAIDGSVGDLAFYTTTDATVYASLAERIRILSGGFVGIATATPDRLFHAEVSDAGTNAVVFAQRLSHISSGTVVAGFGVGIEFELEENTASTNRLAGYITCDWQDAGEGASADGRLNFGVMTADAAAATAMSIWNNYVGIGTLVPGVALEVKAASGQAVAIAVSKTDDVDGRIVGQLIHVDNSGGAIDLWNDSNVNNIKLRSYGDSFILNRVGFGIAAPLAQVHIDQATSDAAIPVLSLDQADISDGFINFIGATAASAAGPISSWTNATINGFVRAEVNGAQVWLATYNDPTS